MLHAILVASYWRPAAGLSAADTRSRSPAALRGYGVTLNIGA